MLRGRWARVVLTTTAVQAAAFLVVGCAGSGRAAPAPVISLNGAGTPASTGQSPVPVESNPPGDSPDGLGYVVYSSPTGHYSFTHPEGWVQTGQAAAVTFVGKLSGVHAEPGVRKAPPTPADARTEIPALQAAQAAFEVRTVGAASLPAGNGVLIVYRRNSPPDPVTGRQYRDEVQRYEVVKGGREVIFEMFGPVGSDNVDAYRTMSQSLRIA
ncbi:MAG: hypothetical protein M3N21_02280 [Actinomycetota bacterium]|nr:hypothetical protein [Actinomycetota bacterium]